MDLLHEDDAMTHQLQRISTGLIGLAALLAVGCASMDGATGSVGRAYAVVGCPGPFEDVMGDMMRLHDRLRIDGDQEFAWIGYETAYERYVDAFRFRELAPENGVPARDDGLRPLRDRVREARDDLYRALTEDQQTYLAMEACRLSYP